MWTQRSELMVKRIWILKANLFALSIVIACATVLSAFPIPPTLKKTVAFIYAPNQKGELIPNGTGFFIAVSPPEDSNKNMGYLVTAKHVLQKQDKKSFFQDVSLRLNRKNGTAQMVQVPLRLEGANKNVFLHQDPTVDLALIPLLLDFDVYDCLALPSDMIVTKEDFVKLKIGEGTEVFFTGLFGPYRGKQKNYPIVRFGRLALVTDERINWDGIETELYLMETAAYGGNSGSPVFFQVGLEAVAPGKIVVSGDPVIKLAGIMKGFFSDLQPIKIINTDSIPVAPSNMGIAAVVPVHQLYELLFGDEVKKARGF